MGLSETKFKKNDLIFCMMKLGDIFVQKYSTMDAIFSMDGEHGIGCV